MGIGQEVLDVPFGEMVFQVASAIATSQTELDRSSVSMLQVMGDKDKFPVSLPILKEDGQEGEIETSMIGAGFQPAFYQFSDAIIEVKMAISMSSDRSYESKYESKYDGKTESKSKKSKSTSARATTMNANYSSSYNFSEEASSLLRVRLVPLPPNPIMQRLIELRAQRQQLIFEEKIKTAELKLQKDIEAESNKTA